MKWSTCTVSKGLSIQEERVLPQQRSSRPGSYPSGRGSNEAAGAWEKEMATVRNEASRRVAEGNRTGQLGGMSRLPETRQTEEVGDSISL